jgi:hypothetical protein
MPEGLDYCSPDFWRCEFPWYFGRSGLIYWCSDWTMVDGWVQCQADWGSWMSHCDGDKRSTCGETNWKSRGRRGLGSSYLLSNSYCVPRRFGGVTFTNEARWSRRGVSELSFHIIYTLWSINFSFWSCSMPSIS